MSPVALWSILVFASASERPVDFDTGIVPVLTKAGCNAGACHGAAAGRGGLHLSLLGADPSADYETIVHAFEGRRINLSNPELSLFLAKPTGELDHEGGVPLDANGPGANRLLTWIRAGTPRGSRRRLISVDVTPVRHHSLALPSQIPLRVMARFDDGPLEDVTAWTVFTASDAASVQIDGEFVAHVRRRGQHVVIARFLDRVIPIQLTIPLSDTTVDLASEPRANFIDAEILRVLTELRVPVSPPASDATYLRRVSLDLTGRLPDRDSVEAFAREESPDKRERLVERLLASEAFAEYWTLRLARLLRVHSLPNESEGVRAYADWLRRELQNGTGMDAMAYQLLTATGDSHQVGPANFGRMVGDARGHAELVGQVFLGVRLGCANCHNHPLDRWTQDDYHGLAAVFARLDRGREVRVLARGAVTNVRTNEPAIPRIPGVRYLVAHGATANGDFRADVAEWLTSPENRSFPRATVNRLWRAMFGHGLVEPTDDMRQTNPATHPELLDLLADDFVKHGYRIRHTLRRIALSHTYARGEAVAANHADSQFYSNAQRRRLEPEVLLDAIADVTDVPEMFAGIAAGRRAVSLVDPLTPAPSLDLLGRCSRASGCDEIPEASGGLATQLHLMNGILINHKLTDGHGRLSRLIKGGSTDDEIVREFYLCGLGRNPTSAELQNWRQLFTAAPASETPDAADTSGATRSSHRTRQLEDFVWSLLNSRQFIENH